ncbi:hypothetical protein J2752_002000 [Halarchaeum rubridurum]|uniref:Uncharacterized protein n=1 Tax=Halarchaeum rubridurum TaxID=489911 RepID=A0A830G0A6_9EURY|nr:hypothetical protein [Halarchaeum rubridurum]MBP1955088.1 hypothetical protein [Halarchaeum rubridurum]GGM69029.1 hypothetical protein GCM10009017_19070 [Halarchaeum rubridurum]
MKAVKAIQQNSEKVVLAVYMAAIVVFAALLTPMLGDAWRGGGLTRFLFRTRLLVGLSLDVIASALLGLYFGFLLLMVVDTKKRLQGVLLFAGSVIALIILSGMGLLLPNIDSISNLPWIAIGLAASAFLGGGRTLSNITSGGVLEFRGASKAIYYILTAVVVLSFVEFHLEYQLPVSITAGGISLPPNFSPRIQIIGGAQQIIFHTILVTGFVVTARRFVTYDAEQDFFVLGPKASGKSLLLVGSYLEALNRLNNKEQQVPLDPSQDLMNLVGELDRQQDGWFVDATRQRELEDLQFKYVHGSIFPRNVQVSTLDYAGELLEQLPDALMSAGSSGDLPSTVNQASRSIQEADTLVLLIDSNRFLENERLDIEPYFDILQATDSKEVILVATKSDIFAEEFREEQGLQAQQYFDEFKQYVDDRLSQNQSVQALKAQTDQPVIHPVYYQTRIDENGERVPMRNSGSVATVGFDRLLDMLGEK